MPAIAIEVVTPDDVPALYDAWERDSDEHAFLVLSTVIGAARRKIRAGECIECMYCRRFVATIDGASFWIASDDTRVVQRLLICEACTTTHSRRDLWLLASDSLLNFTAATIAAAERTVVHPAGTA